MKLYHLTKIDNLESILKQGLIPAKSEGVMFNRDGYTYLADDLEYLRIIADDIALWPASDCVILEVYIPDEYVTPVWWEGKGYKEYITKRIIKPDQIKVYGGVW